MIYDWTNSNLRITQRVEFPLCKKNIWFQQKDSQRVVIRIYLLFGLQVFLKPLVTNDDDDDDDDGI